MTDRSRPTPAEAREEIPADGQSVHILGGGLAGLVTAWALSAPQWKADGAWNGLRVTVYDESWAPGGKARSGRGESKGKVANRVEEHGLHMLFGTYHCTWRILDALYSSGKRCGQVFDSMDAAFSARPDVYFTQPRDGDWDYWGLGVGPRGGDHARPWEPRRASDRVPDDLALLELLLNDIAARTRSIRSAISGLQLSTIASPPGLPAEWQPGARDVRTAAQGQLRDWDARNTARWTACAKESATAAGTKPPTRAELLEQRALWALVQLAELGAIFELVYRDDPFWSAATQVLRRSGHVQGTADQLRHVGHLLDLVSALLVGCLEDNVFTDDGPTQFDKLNEFDLSDWLALHGAKHAESALVRGFYGGLFAYPAGVGPGSLAAGTGLRAMLRVLLDYRGHMVYAMNGGMGEVVIAPLCRTLEAQGVRFKRHHRVTQIEFARAGDTLKVSSFKVSTTYVKGSIEDDAVSGAGIVARPWPGLGGRTLDHFPASMPGAADALESRLHREHAWDEGVAAAVDCVGDHVVLAIPPAAHRHLLQDLVARKAPAAVRKVWAPFLTGQGTATESVGTIGVQLWFRAATVDLGWSGEIPIVGAFERPLDTWADVSHLIASEDWLGRPPAQLSFLVGVRPPLPEVKGGGKRVDPKNGRRPAPSAKVPQATTQALEDERIDAVVNDWLTKAAPGLWERRGYVDQEVDRHVVASRSPSDQYVLSVPGTIGARPRPDGSGVDNLSLAGDWVRNGLDCGSAESAVVGGLLAALHVLRKAKAPGLTKDMGAEDLLDLLMGTGSAGGCAPPVGGPPPAPPVGGPPPAPPVGGPPPAAQG